MTGATKIRAGLWRIDGVVCRCGGEIRTQGAMSWHPEFKWELFCCKCQRCDPNGYPTLRECIARAGEYHGKAAGK